MAYFHITNKKTKWKDGPKKNELRIFRNTADCLYCDSVFFYTTSNALLRLLKSKV